MSSKLPPCDHDDCPPTHCKRQPFSSRMCELGTKGCEVNHAAVAICQRTVIENGKMKTENYDVPVRVIAEAEGYAMVRRKRCVPFVIESKRLRKPNKKGQP